MRHADLCSGIGGFALAAQWVGGIETVLFCEIDEWAQKILNKNFKGVPIHGDLKTLDLKNYGRIDIITCGYPCQPFSVAGQQRGAEDDRHLWPEVFRIVKASRPRMVLCENVAGHVNMGLDDVLSDLESEGYSVQAIIIPACAVDAKHRRDRVWIMGYAEHDGSPAQAVGGVNGEDGNHYTQGRSRPSNLREQVDEGAMRMWPTPRAGKTTDEKLESWQKRKDVGKVSTPPLTLAVKMWPTPSANEDAAGTPAGKMQKMLGNSPMLRGTTQEEWDSGTLNPNWVEWLMGYPTGHTDLKDLETPSCPKSPPKSSE